MSKLLSFSDLTAWRTAQRIAGRRVVVTNGCFDILHAGHVHYLQAARSWGDVLLVGLNSDGSVRGLKGPTRPVNGEQDRATVLAALACVDYVSVFPTMRATLLLQRAAPDVYVKGGDYTLAKLDPEERAVLEAGGAEIRFIPFVPGHSTTALLEKSQRL